MSRNLQLNQRSVQLLKDAIASASQLRLAVVQAEDATLVDFGIDADGGIAAGLMLARICMADLGHVELQAAAALIDLPQVFVRTDHPLEACLLSQYAGWKIATDDYFAMGSGPMRAAAAREDLFGQFPATNDCRSCAGVLEANTLPTASAVNVIRDGVGNVDEIILATAPTASQAGNMQVVARSVETAMHKLHELGFPVERIISGTGAAPLPPVALDDMEGIGRTNDAILYGSTVNLWVDCADHEIEHIGPRTPSNASSSHGQPFLKLFKEANHDFYALDKALFSPAVVMFHNLQTGCSFRFGTTVPDLLHESFGI